MLEIASHPIVAMIFLIAVLIFVHELGHFLVGRYFNIGVESFSVGFGPTLVSFTHKHTCFKISLLPLGGYVKFAGVYEGEDVPEVFKGQELYKASSLAQAATMAAGPLANLLLAAVLYFGMGFYGIERAASIVGYVQKNSPAYKAGFLSGDRIVSINDKKINTWREMLEIISVSSGKKLSVKVNREGEESTLVVIPKQVSGSRKQAKIGIGYAFPSNFISLNTEDSYARRAGFKTGDQIVSFSYDGSENNKVRHWRDIELGLLEATKNRTATISFKIKREIGEKGKPLIITIPISLDNILPKSSSSLASQLGLITSELTIGKTSKDSNLSYGDQILSFKGKFINDTYDLSKALRENKDPLVKVQVQRGQERLELDVKLIPQDVQRPEGKVVVHNFPDIFIGTLEVPDPYIEKYGFGSAIVFGLKEMVDKSLTIVKVVWGLFTGEVPLQSLGGPILIAKVAGTAAKHGWQTFLDTMALISINLGILNLFPIPLFDGGRLVQVGIEVIMRRRMSPAALENYQRIGFVMLLSLMAMAFYNDLSRFWSSILKDVMELMN